MQPARTAQAADDVEGVERKQRLERRAGGDLRHAETSASSMGAASRGCQRESPGARIAQVVSTDAAGRAGRDARAELAYSTVQLPSGFTCAP